jgi:hypothetical protein
MSRLERFSQRAMIASLLILIPLGSVAHGNERGEATANIGDTKVSINYGRPALKG